MRHRPLLERFNEKYVIDPVTGCWLWTAAKNDTGYGLIIDTKPRKCKIASRVSYELFVGPIPSGMDVLHKCDTPPCVNPEHLFLGTDMDNSNDREAKGRPVGGSCFNIFKTHCPQGHEYTPENTKIGTDGSRHCRLCRRARDVVRNQNRKAERKLHR